ncbi:MAG: tetratricopeptide repeat protein [Desulfobacterales bacterium]|nr:tetratricopeptide repeat protein [Desulfobacterales bacterium]MBF0395480.1 tetratricopeptide repeat protein [Desulfobacterales bacterium]
MATTKISTRQFLKEPDKFITFSEKLIQNAIKYKREIAISASVIIALIIIVNIMTSLSNSREDSASFEIEQVNKKYEELNTKDPKTAFENIKKDFQTVLDKYSNTSSGKFAKINYASICYNANNYDNAIDLYKKALDDFNQYPELKQLILNSLGYCYEGKKEYKTALEYFEKVSSEPDSILKDEAFFNMGRIYALMKDEEKSLSAFQKINAKDKVNERFHFIYSDLVKEKLAINKKS